MLYLQPEVYVMYTHTKEQEEMSRESSSVSESSNDESQNGLVISGESDTSSINSGHVFVTDSEDEQFTLEKLQRTRKRLADEIKVMHVVSNVVRYMCVYLVSLPKPSSKVFRLS